MHFGASMFFTDYSMTPAELAQALEAARLRIGLGARAFAHPDVAALALPRRRRSAEAVLRRDGPVRDADLAAAATKTLKIGTGVCLVNQRDPIQTAKLVASIDQVSGGRFLFGIGVGWNAEEMEDHGTVSPPAPSWCASASRR